MMAMAHKGIVQRLKIAKGHLEKVISMVEKGDYCMDIVHQSVAVQAALKEIDGIIIKEHMETYIDNCLKKRKTKAMVSEFVRVLQSR